LMDIKDKYLEPFLDEAGENIQKLNECLLAFEQGNQSVIDEIFRVAHTLKGMSATMGFQNMTHLTHAMEDVLDGARKELFQIQGKDDISILFECLDVLNVLLMKIRESKDDSGIDTAPLAEKTGRDRLLFR
jgi:Chemotaxis protein histidine kinase and related kinases